MFPTPLHAARRALAAIAMIGLTGSASAERLPIRTYTTSDGLPNGSIGRVVQDSDGAIWAATSGGLSRFDGYRFLNLAEEVLPHAVVNDVLELSTGEYLIATRGGLCRLAISSQVVDGHTTSCARIMIPGGPHANNLNALHKDQSGRWWIGSEGGLFSLDRAASGIAHRVDLGIAW